MTESEIMKELKSAAEWFTEHGRNTNTAIVGICERAIDLINRKNAEIEVYKNNLEAMAKTMHNSAKATREEARAEAIKEVFEKVEERLCVHTFTSKSEEYADGQFDCMEWVDGKIDELKKEMGVEL